MGPEALSFRVVRPCVPEYIHASRRGGGILRPVRGRATAARADPTLPNPWFNPTHGQL